jgi:hypothetical protein
MPKLFPRYIRLVKYLVIRRLPIEEGVNPTNRRQFVTSTEHIDEGLPVESLDSFRIMIRIRGDGSRDGFKPPLLDTVRTRGI